MSCIFPIKTSTSTAIATTPSTLVGFGYAAILAAQRPAIRPRRSAQERPCSCRILLSAGGATTPATHPDSRVSYIFCAVANPAEAGPVYLPLSAQRNERATACLYGVVPLLDMYGVASKTAHEGEEQCYANAHVAGLLVSTARQAAVGLPVGAKSKAIVFLFSTANALERFRSNESWSAGADASVAVIKIGANGNVDMGEQLGR